MYRPQKGGTFYIKHTNYEPLALAVFAPKQKEAA